MRERQKSSAELMRQGKTSEMKALKSQYDAVLAALIKAEADRDRFFSMKQSLAGIYAEERSNRQKMERELLAINNIAGNCVPEERNKDDYERAMDEIFQHCRNIFEPIED
jgi:seryl-tRNA synthetase